MNSVPVSITVPGYSETNPTYFNVQVCIERTTYQVRKRYSDFVEFATKVEQEMGEKSPAELPSKKWVGNKNRAFLDQRARGLEVYLRTMAKLEEWRESLAFQQFLEVHKHVKAATGSGSQSGGWLKGTQEAREYIQKAMISSGGAEERRFIVLAGAKISDLEATLAGDSNLGDGEYRRRKDVLQEMARSLLQLKTQNRGIPGAFDTPNKGLEANEKLSNGGGASRRVLGKGLETDRTRDKSNQQLLQLQKDDMGQQDEMIEYLRQVIGRQKQMGEEINTELLQQAELLDELDNDTHGTSARLNQARRKVGKML